MVRPIKSNFEMTQARLRSAITNGRHMFRAVDHRSSSARRFRDILHDLTEALGGSDALSPQERALVWKVCCLQLWTELIEAKWFAKDTDQPPNYEIFKTYNRAVNSMRRMFRDLGLKGRIKSYPTTMSQKEAEEYLRSRGVRMDLKEGQLDAAE